MNRYKILILLLVSALLISPAAGAVGTGAEEESTWWNTTKDYANYAWETVKEHPWITAVAIGGSAVAGYGVYQYGSFVPTLVKVISMKAPEHTLFDAAKVAKELTVNSENYYGSLEKLTLYVCRSLENVHFIPVNYENMQWAAKNCLDVEVELARLGIPVEEFGKDLFGFDPW